MLETHEFRAFVDGGHAYLEEFSCRGVGIALRLLEFHAFR